MNFLVSILGPSYRTSATGLMTIITVIAAAGKAYFDNDPTTNVDFPTMFASIMAGIGLMKARDNKVSSEAAGLK